MGTSLQIGNLPVSVTEAELLNLFNKFGPVETATIMKNPDSGRSQGTAFVLMARETDAVNAISRLNFSQYDGQVISVSRDLRANRDLV